MVRLGGLIASAVRGLFGREEGRFLVVGLLNTGVGYFAGVFSFLLLSPYLHIVAISAVASVVSICFSFLTQRRWVFRSVEPWWPQLRKSFLVYGGVSIVGTAMLWPLVEVAHVSIWFAQGIVIVACTALSYVGQKWFTFRRPGSGGNDSEKSA